LKEVAVARQMTLSELVAAIDSERRHGNLSSAIRLFVLDHYRGQNNSAHPERDVRREPRPTLMPVRTATA
jgi:predicted DNA-binding ribbon-helix-helix protein